jgi:UDP-glucose 4-epimerase
MTPVWIIGKNGLLGSALWTEFERKKVSLFKLDESLNWDNEYELFNQLEAGVKSFAVFVGKEDNWQIFWAAGIGTMGSDQVALARESLILSKLLSLIEFQEGLIKKNGCFVFSSSAGAIYAGSTEDVVNENTPVSPTTAYGYEKLKQEDLLTRFTITNNKITVLFARISTLYGSGQAFGKRQGLFAEIARHILRNKPIQIFVPFDTIRDYIISQDAAAKIIASANAISRKPGVFLKIIASEEPTTIAEIISIFKQISRRSPKIVTTANKLTSIYSKRIQFKSINILTSELTPRTSLLIGISQVMAAERFMFVRSKK